MKFFLISIFIFAIQLFSNPCDWIGKVIAVEGEVTAQKEDLEERVLSIHSLIYENETISVADNAKIQIRFTDGGLLNLIQGTTYRVKEYRYRVPKTTDRYFAEIIQGGFRSLTGSIAKKNYEEYQIETPSATIGLRGTLFDVAVDGSKVFLGVSHGAVELTNQQGSVLIGPKQKNSFAMVRSPDASPQALVARPQEIQSNLFTPPKGGTPLTQAQAKPSAATPEQPKATTDQKTPETKAPTTIAPETPSATDQKSPLSTPGTVGGGVTIKGGC